MKKIISLLIILTFVLFILTENVKALGGYLTGDYGQVAPVEVKALVDFDGQTETITVTQTFAFNPLTVNSFYWVIALPGDVELKIPKTKEEIQKDIFHDLDKKTQKKFAKDNIFQKLLYPDIIDEKFEPAQTFSREAWVKNSLSAPESNNITELESWFRNNAYAIPKNSREIFAMYLKKGWHFVLIEVDGLHLETDAKESLTINGAHTIPIQIKLKTDQIILPLGLIKIQPDRDSAITPLSFEYGSSSSDVLGIEDSKIDNLLSRPSSSLYPPLLLDLMNVKIDLFVRAKYKVEAKELTTVYAAKEGNKYLTRLVGYKPIAQIEDTSIEKAKDQRRVNPSISLWEKVIRMIALVFIIYQGVRYLSVKKH